MHISAPFTTREAGKATDQCQQVSKQAELVTGETPPFR